MTPRLAIVLLATSLAGCPVPTGNPDGGFTDEPCLDLPDSLDIELVLEGQYNAEEDFTVGYLAMHNPCGFAVSTSAFLEIRQGPRSNQFTSLPIISSPSTGIRIPARGTSDLPVLFQPDSQTTVAGIINLDGPDGNNRTVGFRAESFAAVSQLSTTQLLFKSVPVGCIERQDLSIANTGDADLVVEDLSFGQAGQDAGLSVILPEPLPWTLPPGESVNAQVEYAPTTTEFTTGFQLDLSSNAFYVGTSAHATGPIVYVEAVESGACD